jgi:hypothetical protein
MMPLKLSPELQHTICAYIRNGAFPHVAAEAVGVSRTVFEGWMQKGTAKGGRPIYRQFAAAVRQAIAQARVAAEIKAFGEAPIAWLKSGPGKERADNPGWTTTVKPSAKSSQTINILLTPDGQRLVMTLLQLLAPYPEARRLSLRPCRVE